MLPAAFSSSWSLTRTRSACKKVIAHRCSEADLPEDGYSGVPMVQDFASLYAQEEAAQDISVTLPTAVAAQHSGVSS